MASYLVRLRGEGFPLHGKSGWRLFGFYTLRGVEADSAQEAERLAVYSIHNDPIWDHVRPRAGFPVPRIYPEDITEMDSPVFPDEDYDFYLMGK